MTPREPDRFDKQARELADKLFKVPAFDSELMEIAAALRAAESSALERAAQEFPDTARDHKWVRAWLRALIPPAAAPAAEPRLDNLAAESPAPAAETGKAPTPSLRKECGDNSPEWWTGRWRDWHRGHGCGKDDGQPCTPEGVAEFAAHGRLPGRAAPPEGEGK